MRLKYYVRGVGVGIIITTLVLIIAFAFKSPSVSDEDIIKRATELGMVMQEKEPVEQENKEEIDNTEDTDLSESVDDTEKNAADKFLENIESEKTENESEADGSTEVVTYVPFTVSPGQSSNSVSENLYKAGLVDNADDFNSYLNELGIDDLIQSGTFYVSSNSTYDDIAAALVTKQDKRMTTPPKGE